MLDLSITEFLNEYSTEALNFKALLEMMQSSGIEFRNRRMIGPLGVATFYCIYLDIEKIKYSCSDKMIYFTILHEMAHYKRICRMGKGTLIEMLSLEDQEAFCQHVIGEEIVADRYACYVYQCLNGKEYPRHMTQQLHLSQAQDLYKPMINRYMFGKVKNNEETYIALWEGFIVND